MKRRRTPKHPARKVTPEQLAALNRPLDLVNAPYRYARDEHRRLVRVPVIVDLRW